MATYRTSAAGGASSGTGNRTVAITPAVDDLLVVYCFVAANTNDAPTCSDNNGSGTYDLVDVMNASIGGVNYRMSVFIRTALMVNTTSTTITAATGSNSSGVVHAIAVSGMSRTGLSAVRSKGSQNNQAAGTAGPALNQSALTGNITLVAQGSADTTTTAPTNWTERQDTNQSNDTVALETATRDSGFTGTTITFGAASSTVFCSHALELDNSTLLTRSAVIDGAGAISSTSTFFSVLTGTILVDGAGLVAAVGQRDLLRSTSLGGNVSIDSVGLFFSVIDGSTAIGGSGGIASAGSFFSVLETSAAINTTAAVEVSGLFFSVLERSILLDAAVNNDSTGIFFSILSGAVVVDGVGDIGSAGQGQPGSGLHERSVFIDGLGQITADGLCVLERSNALDSSVTIAVAGEFFSVWESAASLAASADIISIGQRKVLRAADWNALAQIASQGQAIRQHQAAVTLTISGSISIAGAPDTDFFPRKIFNTSRESRILAASKEGRTETVPSKRQYGSI